MIPFPRVLCPKSQTLCKQAFSKVFHGSEFSKVITPTIRCETNLGLTPSHAQRRFLSFLTVSEPYSSRLSLSYGTCLQVTQILSQITLTYTPISNQFSILSDTFIPYKTYLRSLGNKLITYK